MSTRPRHTMKISTTFVAALLASFAAAESTLLPETISLRIYGGPDCSGVPIVILHGESAGAQVDLPDNACVAPSAITDIVSKSFSNEFAGIFGQEDVKSALQEISKFRIEIVRQKPLKESVSKLVKYTRVISKDKSIQVLVQDNLCLSIMGTSMKMSCAEGKITTQQFNVENCKGKADVVDKDSMNMLSTMFGFDVQCGFNVHGVAGTASIEELP
ncbi:hypothetical protein ROZALSC1DRAFT_28549 [Rozella allomycis CSF55]|uniref:Uncharacterized protein n=1 Tax=Rozella allomycis (strain CSF55) TaxID=988480 RepID=A0A075B0F2_ROZAC|nr:hypothetical protein O9G_002697 [Rozella allomycis CSF55]RKP19898.1 hypothetical protein ROZALSC1DRAFT_28549 [Rozella allomycis CSF55]|eukprot:EPZ36054.1 hypothetical protein O9G_002697 [Rozella allomycis CSF55]